MPESRDRLSRPVDLAALFVRRRTSALGILVDEPETESLFRSPIRQQTTATTFARTPMGSGATRGGGGLARTRFGTARTGNWRSQYSYGSPATAARENTLLGNARRGRGRGRNSVLPSWYPRTPLRDITAISRAIERRRARLREDQGLELGSPTPQDTGILDPSASVSVAPLEDENSSTFPRSAVKIKSCPPSVVKVQKILHGIANQTTSELDCFTPEKKLLNSIDTVEKALMEELQKLKKTPSAKKAERERKVRTLMSMR